MLRNFKRNFGGNFRAEFSGNLRANWALRWLHSSRPLREIEGLEDVNEMLDIKFTPPENRTEKKDYPLPRGVFASYRQQRKDPSVRFKDVAVVKLKSGDGGDGKISFLKQAGRAAGPPDGGDGGMGGGVFIQAVEGINSLHNVRHIYKAQNGRAGGSTQLSGKNGENAVLQVPVGTVVRWCPPLDELKALFAAVGPNDDAQTLVDIVVNMSRFDYAELMQLYRPSFKDGQGWLFKEQEEKELAMQPAFKKLMHKVRYFDLINRRRESGGDVFPVHGIDLNKPGEPVQLLSGGMGGLGNMHFQTSDIRSPRFAKKGRHGLEASFLLELRLLADLGLVGLPNAGKSTLLRAISRARPKVGHWEFTTLTPTVGTISMGISEPSFSVADIPGIIAGASENKGLGLGFLRHIERSGGLVFVIALDRPDPIADLQTLAAELGHRLDDKRVLVVATKADVPESEDRYARLAEYVRAWGAERGSEYNIIPCSAHEQGNIEGVIHMMGVTSGRVSV